MTKGRIKKSNNFCLVDRGNVYGALQQGHRLGLLVAAHVLQSMCLHGSFTISDLASASSVLFAKQTGHNGSLSVIVDGRTPLASAHNVNDFVPKSSGSLDVCIPLTTPVIIKSPIVMIFAIFFIRTSSEINNLWHITSCTNYL